MVPTITLMVGVILATAFVLAPLLRSETELKPLRRSRPGTRHLHGLESEDVEVVSVESRDCPHCGATVDADFDFCGECASPLP
jgi:hypothetical protein